MTFVQQLQAWRGWFPVPTSDGEVGLKRWLLLEGNRLAVAGALLTFVYISLMLTGWIWTFEMQKILTETSTVENLLETFLSGIILLVSIVVSINSIVLSQDIASIENQSDRIRGVADFRREVGQLTDSGESPSSPQAFLEVMTTVISERAQELSEVTSSLDGVAVDRIQTYADSITETVDQFQDIDNIKGGNFAVLWTALEVDYGPHLDESRALRSDNDTILSESHEKPFDRLAEALQVFAIGREYFKTLYYTREVSRLSRVLLIVSLPAILFIATAILAISAGVLPSVWLFGLPPLQSFVALVFTISLVPYIVLTSYMMRLSTVATRTTARGLFRLK